MAIKKPFKVKVCLTHSNLCVAYMPRTFLDAFYDWKNGKTRPGMLLRFNRNTGTPILSTIEGYKPNQLRIVQ